MPIRRVVPALLAITLAFVGLAAQSVVAAPSAPAAFAIGPSPSSPATDPVAQRDIPAVVVAPDSVPSAGWFHVTGRPVPLGTAMLRYRNVDRLIQTGVTFHPAGPLSLWFRAPGPPGSRITIRVEALNRWGSVIGTVGTISVTTGDAMLPLPEGTGEGKRMVVDSEAQQVWLVDADGTVRDSFLMSGRRLPTASGVDQPGLFAVYSKSRTMQYCAGRCGTAAYMVRYQRTPVSSVGSHSLPSEGGELVQGVEDLGWPLSHGCTRLEASKAEAVYRWATIGTLVVVL